MHRVGDVGHIIPRIYAAMENRKADHENSIVEMDDKLCDQVFLYFDCSWI